MCYLISDDAVRVCSLSGNSISSNNGLLSHSMMRRVELPWSGTETVFSIVGRRLVTHFYFRSLYLLISFVSTHGWLGSVSRLPPSILVLAMPKGRNSVDGHSFEET